VERLIAIEIQTGRSQAATGLIYGAVAYGLWGLFPLYFVLLDSVSPVEVVAHRVVWSLVFLAVALFVIRGWRNLFRTMRSTRTFGLLALAAVFLSINWGVYVWAVQNDDVVQASLGYFINPLVSVGLGVVILRERLRHLQWAAVGLAVVAVVVLAIAMGHPPWISLVLATSFGIYGLLKKVVGVGSVPSLAIETLVLTPVALMIILIAVRGGHAGLVHDGPGTTALLIMLGPVTAIPLIAFGAAATRIPLSTLGLMQFLTPTLQFIMGITIFHETMTTGSWVGFIIVWLALCLFGFDIVRHSRSGKGQQTPSRIDDLEVVKPD
jgi:chloramphenicol-sensitive protein RarD